MKAKCPFCEDGCEKCTDGHTEATFASGTLWARHCNACGEDNGGCIFKGPPQRKPMDCVWCKSADVIWLEVGDTRYRRNGFD